SPLTHRRGPAATDSRKRRHRVRRTRVRESLARPDRRTGRYQQRRDLVSLRRHGRTDGAARRTRLRGDHRIRGAPGYRGRNGAAADRRTDPSRRRLCAHQSRRTAGADRGAPQSPRRERAPGLRRPIQRIHLPGFGSRVPDRPGLRGTTPVRYPRHGRHGAGRDRRDDRLLAFLPRARSLSPRRRTGGSHHARDHRAPDHIRGVAMTTDQATARGPAPLGGSERIPGPDLARGFMLLLIVLANTAYYLYGGQRSASGAHPVDGSALDTVVQGILITTVDLRVYPMFAFLFGYGLVMIARRQEQRGLSGKQVRSVIQRRNLWLIAFGAVHALLLWGGDILGAYGLTGLVLVWLFLRRSDRTLLIWAGIGTALVTLVAALSTLGAVAVLAGEDTGS